MSPDPRAWIAALRASHSRLASLTAAMTDSELAQQSYASEWTITQVLSHLGSGAQISRMWLAGALDGSGAPDPASFPEIWAAWDAKTAGEKAQDCLAENEAHISRLESLTDAELASIRLQLFGMDLDAARLVGLRLAEHAVHTWDVAVALDPQATVDADAVALLLPGLAQFVGWAAKPAGEDFSLRLRAADADVDWLLEVTDAVTMSAWPGGGKLVGEIVLPAEALLRLVYGRLDRGHTPPAQITGDADLDRVRAVFPGF
jgi:uncharacterized protein (TIGR03083 family)